jgi:hypothetical protein
MAVYCPEVLEAVEDPDAIYEGSSGELLSIRKMKSGKYIVVAYKEVSKTDGFIITAFITRKVRQFER